MEDLIKGVDVSSLLEVERCGGKFYDGGRQGDALEILARYGINYVRLRLWNDPFDKSGEDYGGGVCDLNTVLTLAVRAKKAGMKFLLDLQYSDFWTDPGCQTLPKAWQNLGEAELEAAVYRYTREVLAACRSAGAAPDMVQVGNELTGGLLWPTGQNPNWNNICRYLSAGVRAVREEAPQARAVIHLDHGGKNLMYRDWFDHYFQLGGDCDLIGLSFYPCWHGKMEDLAANMNDLALRYSRDLVVIEAGTAFTSDSYASYENLEESCRKGPTAGADMAERLEYPMTRQGQTAYIQDLMHVIRAVPENRGTGFFWWEPCWLPVPGSSWAKKSGWEYVGKQGPEGNEWANQTLFDFDGHGLPALDAIRDF